MRYTASIVLAVWVIGLATFWTYTTATGGWYSHRLISATATDSDVNQWIERDGCEPVWVNNRPMYFRCPRFRLH
jgi:hypothetical protein